jgi:hypothetical protein
MRKPAIILGVLALAAVALAQTPPVISKTFQQTYLTDGGVTSPFTAPTGICTAEQGIDMTNATGWQVILSADAGDTLAGALLLLRHHLLERAELLGHHESMEPLPKRLRRDAELGRANRLAAIQLGRGLWPPLLPAGRHRSDKARRGLPRRRR